MTGDKQGALGSHTTKGTEHVPLVPRADRTLFTTWKCLTSQRELSPLPGRCSQRCQPMSGNVASIPHSVFSEHRWVPAPPVETDYTSQPRSRWLMHLHLWLLMPLLPHSPGQGWSKGKVRGVRGWYGTCLWQLSKKQPTWPSFVCETRK